jgi:hypothetical protein
MGFLGTALTHALAHRTGKAPFFFSRFIFVRMHERKNTHYCFHCGGDVGFRPEKVGRFLKQNDLSKPTNHIEDGGYNHMSKHDVSHADAVIGNAHKYRNVWDWLEGEISKKKDFPYIVSIPSI